MKFFAQEDDSNVKLGQGRERIFRIVNPIARCHEQQLQRELIELRSPLLFCRAAQLHVVRNFQTSIRQRRKDGRRFIDRYLRHWLLGS